MANYSVLLADIASAIYENHNNEIDALDLKGVLDEMVASLGDGYLLKKTLATPSTNPGTPDTNVAYFATQAGTYTNFDGIQVAAGEVALLCWDGSWTKLTTGAMSAGAIVDNLTTNDATKPLSAKQGKVLKDAQDATAAEVAALGQYVSNPDYIRAYTDADGRFLWGIKQDGSIEWAKGVPQPIRDFVAAEIAAGRQFTDEQVASLVELIATFYTTTDPEYIAAITDNIGRILFGITKSGELYSKTTEELKKSSNSLNDIFYLEEDAEKLSLTLGPLNEVISYRGKDGTLHENTIQAKTINADVIGGHHYPPITTKEEEYLERPKFAELFIYNSYNYLPCPNNEVVIKVNNVPVLHTRAALEIQGHGSAQYDKKGFTIDFLNDAGDALAIKFGNMASVDSFHLKAYTTDRTHSRGVAGANIFRELIASLDPPYDKMNNIPLDISASQKKDCLFIADARYGEDGFPVAVYVNDEFWGLHTIKLKKTRQNYAMQKDVKTEIFLDSITYDAFLNEAFDASDWELKNPKLSGYEEGGEITDAGVLTNIQRLFYFTNNISTEHANHADYIVLPHWICWYILVNLIGHYDTSGNNMELLTWDGTHWSIIPYDMDLTVGLDAWGGYQIRTTQSGFIGGGTFFSTFRSLYGNEISQIYTKLRKVGIISVDHIFKIYVNQCDSIPRDIQQLDKEKWPNIWNNGYPTIEQIYSYIKSRIDYLDTQWLNN